MKKTFMKMPGGRRKLVRGRFSGYYHPVEKQLDDRRAIHERVLNQELRAAMLCQPAELEIVPDYVPVNDHGVVVSCGPAECDDTDGSDRHLFIPIHSDPDHEEPAPQPAPIQLRPFQPKKRQLLPIDGAIRRCCA